LDVAARDCGGRGPYANSIVGRNGVGVRGDCATERHTWHDGAISSLRRQSTLKSVVEKAERRDVFSDKAERYGPCRGARRDRSGESDFVLQRWPPVENEVGFRQRWAAR